MVGRGTVAVIDYWEGRGTVGERKENDMLFAGSEFSCLTNGFEQFRSIQFWVSRVGYELNCTTVDVVCSVGLYMKIICLKNLSRAIISV